jgi:hypothetical protein
VAGNLLGQISGGEHTRSQTDYVSDGQANQAIGVLLIFLNVETAI